MTIEKGGPRLETAALASTVRSSVLEPGDAGWDEAWRVWNARFDARPAAIVRPTGVGDIVAAVDFARERDILLAVRGGGHSYAGHGTCDGGLVLDLASMRGVRLDPHGRTASVEPGVTWGRFDHDAQTFGLATTGGTVSTVGVAGLTLGGGSGYGTRKHGLAVDHLRSADVVTADGRLVHAGEEENPDLFWALRGGGGNFGVVTSFEFELHEVGPEVLAGQVVHPFAAARQVLRFYRDYMAGAPDEVDCYAFALRVPPTDAFPEAYHGEVAIDLVACHSGPVAEAEAALRPLRAFGEPILDTVRPQTYTRLKRAFDEGLPAGKRYDSKAHYLPALPDAAIDVMVDGVREMPGAYTVAYLEPLGGAVARVDPGATAFPHREAAHSFHVLAGWEREEDDADVTRWAKELHEAMAPHATGGVYVNLLGRDEEDRVRAAYGANYERLARIKETWDPENTFRVNHNIRPGG